MNVVSKLFQIHHTVTSF